MKSRSTFIYVHHSPDIDLALGVMIPVFSSGIAKVCYSAHVGDGKADVPPEYLRGKGTANECDPLFKDYKACLTVCI
jgi:hypothetical protein